MDKAAIIGAGRLGEVLLQRFLPLYPYERRRIGIYDWNQERAQLMEKTYGVTVLHSAEEALEAKAVFLAVHRDGVFSFFTALYPKAGDCFCINLCSFLTLPEIEEAVFRAGGRLRNNLASCKIIGHYDRLRQGGKCAVIADLAEAGKETAAGAAFALRLLGTLGDVVRDREEKYARVNLTAARAAVAAALSLCDTFRAAGMPPSVTEAAVSQVFAGTAGQFPFEAPDYFLKKIIGPEEELYPVFLHCLEYLQTAGRRPEPYAGEKR